jgi:hypothetical protein
MKHMVANMCSSICCDPIELVDAVRRSTARGVDGVRHEARRGTTARSERWATRDGSGSMHEEQGCAMRGESGARREKQGRGTRGGFVRPGRTDALRVLLS